MRSSISLYVVFVFFTVQRNADAYNGVFKKDIVDEMQKFIDSRMKNMETKIVNLQNSLRPKINSTYTDKTMTNLSGKLALISDIVNTIEKRTSVTQLNLQEVKSSQDKIYNETLFLKENLNSEFLALKKNVDKILLSVESIEENKEKLKIMKKDATVCVSPGGACDNGTGTCREDCLATEHSDPVCGGSDLKCCKPGNCPNELVHGDEDTVCPKSDGGKTWQDAVDYCSSIGFILAQPKHLLSLSKKLADTQGASYWYWLGGKGDGSNQVFLNGSTVDQSLSEWQSGYPKTSTTDCLVLDTDSSSTTVLKTKSCSSSSGYTVCTTI